ncbi:Uncharacterised protein [Mycobacterium tuberculosis]|uniref:Uncharacterized protein n=1 Tax=Mycobacterium tuberculosis TaxID=1773 RepID=A0A0U0T8D7_MYCTX|nr:Uncharacterised protein [Mycobacterium tuberculosis]CFS53939.1 Uncharacterised protein [Mycobacterium tuberculosis]CKT51814.1 Uncharacterised protein [Mycobacterium tuberculosis]CKT59518.1 Uncharacterised protein [Mycobacterium tuberculosis]CKU70905.1 Uncharacterised protein [Mycobacterium tuberculosis]
MVFVLAFVLVAKRMGSGKVERFGGALEQIDQGVEFDRVGMFLQVVLAGYRPHHLRSALMGLDDDRLQLARQFQIYCHD